MELVKGYAYLHKYNEDDCEADISFGHKEPNNPHDWKSRSIVEGLDENVAERLVSCWNAMVGIADPIAYMKYAHGCIRTIEGM